MNFLIYFFAYFLKLTRLMTLPFPVFKGFPTRFELTSIMEDSVVALIVASFAVVDTNTNKMKKMRSPIIF